MKKLTITIAILLILVFGGWATVKYIAATPYGPLDTRAAIVLKLVNLTSKTEAVPTVAQMRESNKKLTKVMTGKTTPVAKVSNQQISGPQGNIPIRIYTPEGAGPFPIVMFYHGGGWVNGSLDSHDNTCRKITRYGKVIVVAVDYRLAPEHPFPAAPEDCYAALLWANQHALDLDGEPERMAVAGDSAGGNLATVVAIMARDRKGPKLCAQALVYPVTNLSSMDTESYHKFSEGYFLTKARMERFRDLYTPNPTDRLKPEVSPLLTKDLNGLPPALIITEEFDPLRDEGEAYAERLKAAGVDTALIRYPGLVHGFVGVDRILPQAEKATVQIGTFLHKKCDKAP